MKTNPWLFLFKILLIIYATTVNAIASDALIVPGRCIGRVCLDDKKNISKTGLGMPSLKKKLANGYEVAIWSSPKSRKPEHIFIVYYKGRVTDIHITSGRFKTKDGISTFSKFDDARAAYPRGEEVEYSIFESAHNRVDWVVKEQGMTFTAANDTEGPIIRIAIHKIGKAKTIGYSEGNDWYWYPK